MTCPQVSKRAREDSAEAASTWARNPVLSAGERVRVAGASHLHRLAAAAAAPAALLLVVVEFVAAAVAHYCRQSPLPQTRTASEKMVLVRCRSARASAVTAALYEDTCVFLSSRVLVCRCNSMNAQTYMRTRTRARARTHTHTHQVEKRHCPLAVAPPDFAVAAAGGRRRASRARAATSGRQQTGRAQRGPRGPDQAIPS